MNRAQDSSHEANGNMTPGPCGYVFDKSEQVYICDTCSVKGGRALCLPCFHSTNHEGHNVIMFCNPESEAGFCCSNPAPLTDKCRERLI